MKIKRLLSVLLAVLVVAGTVPMAFNLNAKAEEAAAITALQTAWQNLKKETPSIWAAPAGSAKLPTSSETAEKMGVTIAEIGDYYIKAADGTDYDLGVANLDNLSGCNKVEISVVRVDESGTPTVANLEGKNVTLSLYKTANPVELVASLNRTVNNGKVSIKSSDTDATALFTDDYVTSFLRVRLTDDLGSDKFLMGSAIAYKAEMETVPTETTGWTAFDWYKAANDVNVSKYDKGPRTTFNNALNNLKLFAQEGLIDDLKTAWGNLEKESAEVWATPVGGTDVNDDIIASFGKTAAEVGTKYIDLTSNAQFNLDPAFSLSGYDRVEVAMQLINSEGAVSSAKLNYNFTIELWKSDWTYFTGSTQQVTSDKKLVITKDTANMESAFASDASYSLLGGAGGGVRLKTYSSFGTDKLRVGSIIAYKTVKVTIPSDDTTANWTIEDWIKAAEKIDTNSSKINNADAFVSVLNKLREFTKKGKAFNDLYGAWGNLEKESAEVWATPVGGTDVNDDIIASFGKTAAEVGTKYIDLTSNAQFIFAPAFSLNGYDRVEVAMQLINSEGAVSSANLNYNFTIELWKSNWTYFTGSTQQVTSDKKLVITKDTANMESVFASNASYSLLGGANGGVRLKTYSSFGTDKLRVGSIIAYKTAKSSLPKLAEYMTIDELVAAARNFDTTGYKAEDIAKFNSALAKAEATCQTYTDKDGDEIARQLIEAWEKLGVEVPIEILQPEGGLNVTAEIAQKMDIPQEKLGSVYLDATSIPSDFNVLFKAPSGIELGNLVGYDRVELAFRLVDSEGNAINKTKNRCVVLQLISSYAGAYLYSETGVVAFDATHFEDLFTNSEHSTNYIKARQHGTEADGTNYNIRFGSMIGYKQDLEKVPEEYKEYSLPILYSYAKALDLDKFQLGVDEFSAVLAKAQTVSEYLVAEAEQELASAWKDLDLTPATENIFENAMALDLSTVVDTEYIPAFRNALYRLRCYKKEGYFVNNIKTAWEALGKELPENFAQMSIEKLIEEANLVDTSGCEQVLIDDFNNAILRALDFITVGRANANNLKDLIAKADTMVKDKDDYIYEGWVAFEKELANSKKVIADYNIKSQRDIDVAEDSLLDSWGKLRYFKRALLWDIYDHYQNEVGVAVSFSAPGNPDLAENFLIQEQNLPNGLDTASRIIIPENSGWNVYSVSRTIEPPFPTLKGSEYIEFFVRTGDDFTYLDNGKASIYMQWTTGNSSWIYQITIYEKDKGNWVQMLIPTTAGYFRNNSNEVIEGENLYNSEVDLVSRNFTFLNCVGTIDVSSAAYIKSVPATAGVVPEIPVIDISRPPVIEPEAPKNPIDGVDLGDPWGLTVKPPVVEEEKEEDKDTEGQEEVKFEEVVNEIITTQTFTKGGIKEDGTKVNADQVRLSIKHIGKGDIYNSTKKALKNLADRFIILDLALTADNEEVKPDGIITMRLNVPESFDKNRTILCYIDESGKLLKIKTRFEDSQIVFETDKLGNFVLAELNDKSASAYNQEDSNNNIWLIVIICVAAVILIAGAVLLIIILRRRAISKKI